MRNLRWILASTIHFDDKIKVNNCRKQIKQKKIFEGTMLLISISTKRQQRSTLHINQSSHSCYIFISRRYTKYHDFFFISINCWITSKLGKYLFLCGFDLLSPNKTIKHQIPQNYYNIFKTKKKKQVQLLFELEFNYQ
jgi:hypothetical protein